MYALGVTKGSYDGYGRLCFLPTATISRQEALTMLGRLLELGYAAPEWSFTDSDAIADWARGHINTLCAIGRALRATPTAVSTPLTHHPSAGRRNAVQHDVKNASSSCRAFGKSCLRDCVEGLSSPGIEIRLRAVFIVFYSFSSIR